MSDKTFKQAVEVLVGELQRGECYRYRDNHKPCDFRYEGLQGNCVMCISSRILSAHNAELDRIAEGMPKHQCHQTKGRCYICQARDEFLIDCQAYIQAQKGS